MARALLPLLLLVSACGFTEAPAAWTTTVDSLPGGAALVVNQPPPGPITSTWTVEEELRIGAVDGEGPSSFGLVKGLAVTEDGRIAVLDAQARELRIFDPEGRHLHTFGRQGAGPGELEEGFGLMRSPEGELWVPDHRNRRLNVFDPATGYLRSHPLPMRRYGWVWDGAITTDGRLLERSITLDAERRDILRVYDRDMRLLDSLAMPASPGYDRDDPPHGYLFGTRGVGTWGMRLIPFFPGELQVIDPEGAVLSTRFGDHAYRIFRWRPGTLDTTLVLETRRPPVPVTSVERDSALAPIAEEFERYGAPAPDPDKVPAIKPFVEGMFVSGDGRLWVRTPSADGMTTFDVYERSGRYLGTTVTPLRISRWVPPVVRGDRIWALVTDALDVPYVVRGRLVPTTPGQD